MYKTRKSTFFHISNIITMEAMNLMVEYTSGLGTAIVIPVLLKHNIPEKLEESPKTVDQLS